MALHQRDLEGERSEVGQAARRICSWHAESSLRGQLRPTTLTRPPNVKRASPKADPLGALHDVAFG